MNNQSPFVGCVFSITENQDFFMVLSKFVDNAAQFIVANQQISSSNSKKFEISTNISKGRNINLMPFTRWVMPCDGLHGFKIEGFIPGDVVIELNYQIDNIKALPDDDRYIIRSLARALSYRSFVIDKCSHSPMAVPSQLDIQDFVIDDFELTEWRFELFWYPDSDHRISLIFNMELNEVFLCHLHGGMACGDKIYINSQTYEFDNDGELLLRMKDKEENKTIEYLIREVCDVLTFKDKLRLYIAADLML